MSSSLLVSIQGLLALPRQQPLGDVSASFGREWALRQSKAGNGGGSGLPDETYAALYRTFCLDNRTFLAISRWDRPAVASAPDRQPDRGAAHAIPPIGAGRPAPDRVRLSGVFAPLPATMPRSGDLLVSEPAPPVARLRDACRFATVLLIAALVVWWLYGLRVAPRSPAPAGTELATATAPVPSVEAPVPAAAAPVLTANVPASPAVRAVQTTPVAASRPARIQPATTSPRAAARRPAASPEHDDEPFDGEALLRMEAAARAEAATVPNLGIPAGSTTWADHIAHRRLLAADAQ